MPDDPRPRCDRPRRAPAPDQGGLRTIPATVRALEKRVAIRAFRLSTDTCTGQLAALLLLSRPAGCRGPWRHGLGAHSEGRRRSSDGERRLDGSSKALKRWRVLRRSGRWSPVHWTILAGSQERFHGRFRWRATPEDSFGCSDPVEPLYAKCNMKL